MNKKHVIITIITLSTVIMMLITFLTLPSYFREKGELYEKFEYAQMYLTDKDYDRLWIEYDYVSGCYPSPAATELLEERIAHYCDKEQITGDLDDVVSDHDRRLKYSKEYIYELTERYRDKEREGKTMALHVLYLDGTFRENNVLGFSYDGDKIVIFKQTIRSIADKSRNLETEDVEESVLVHELGHLLGLVGIGYESGHEDPSYENHCDESAGQCVMDASVEVRVGGFSQDPPDDFCPLCQGDIEDIRDMKDELGVEEYTSFGIIVGEAMVGIGGVSLISSKEEGKENGYDIYKEHYRDNFEKKRY